MSHQSTTIRPAKTERVITRTENGNSAFNYTSHALILVSRIVSSN